jgi:beta-lactamase regulating signal transducer with metallopeptidase domain/protocatechuate 3,4-dioxygenase beta subunit
MLDLLHPGRSLGWDLVWQPIVFLCLGLAASFLLRRRPARAHRALVLSLVAALATPLLSQAIHRVGLGLLAPEAGASPAPEPSMSPPDATEPHVAGDDPRHRTELPPAVAPERRDSGPDATVRTAMAARPAALPAEPIASSSGADRASNLPSISVAQWAVAVWALVACLLLARLTAGFLLGRRLVREAVVVENSPMNEHLSHAVSRLGLGVRPELRASERVLCPSIWCWGRRPVLLVPAGAAESGRLIDWVGVFGHELAHWRRMDHLTALAGQLLVCVLPWNPLAWWTRSRMAQLAELACDDWVLATGTPGAEYAESLLELVPQRAASPALAAVSSRSGLVQRIRHVLADGPSSPIAGRRWSLAVVALTCLAASALALAQSRTPSAKGDDEKQPSIEAKHPSATEGEPAAGLQRTIRGRVLDAGGQPIAGATLVWFGTRRPPVPHVALPRGSDQARRPDLQILARSQSDGQGRFVLTSTYDPKSYSRFNGVETAVVALAPGHGMLSKHVAPLGDAGELAFTLPKEVVIRGRLLTPAGQPATGVRVHLGGFYNDMDVNVGMHFGNERTDDELPPFWPRPRKTDADGRFTIEGVPAETYATVTFQHPDYAVDEVTVTTRSDGVISPGLKGFEIVPVPPDFTHTLEPARPVQGRVTDRESGKPLAGMLVEMIPMRRHGGMPFYARTDDDGRYRVSGHQADNLYITTVYPAADSGYLSAKDMRQQWPAGAKALEVNFALKRGVLASGTVVDGDSKKPVPGAAVVYQASRKNPHNSEEFDLRNTVLTDAQGRFKITALPGKGMVAVETPDPNYIRNRFEGTTYSWTAYPQGHADIDVPEKGEPTPVEVVVKRGVTLEARLLDPDGKPVRDATAMYPGIDAALIDVWNHGQDVADGLFEIQGADPGKTYRVFFMKPRAQLGCVATLKYDPKRRNPIEVRLRPTATVKGKVVNPDGSPAAQPTQVMPYLFLGDVPKKIEKYDELFELGRGNYEFFSNVLGQRNFHHHDREAGRSGEFSFDAMIPGASFYVSASGAGRSAVAGAFDLKPGEVRDLGTLTLKERDR